MHRRRIVYRQKPIAPPPVDVVAPRPVDNSNSVSTANSADGVSEFDKYNPDINETLVKESATTRVKLVKEYKNNLTNEPYKPITNIDRMKKYCEQKDLQLEMDKAVDEAEMRRRMEERMREREVLEMKAKQYFSKENEDKHKKQFEYTQQQIYRASDQVMSTSELVQDRKGFYTKSLEENQQRKKQFNNMLNDLSKLGII